MIIAYNSKNKKYNPVAEIGETISNIEKDESILKIRMFKDSKHKEIHLNSNSGQILTKNERIEKLPKEQIFLFTEDNCYLKKKHYIDEKGDHERIRFELYYKDSNEYIGKSSFDWFPIFQSKIAQPEVIKEEILNSKNPWRQYEKMGYRGFSLAKKIAFWHSEFRRKERFNDPYPLPNADIGLNLLNCWHINNIYSIFEGDLKLFIIELAKSFRVEEKYAIEIYESRKDPDKWNDIANKIRANK